MTENGFGSSKVSLSIVTVFSSIDSKKALCVFGQLDLVHQQEQY